MVSDNRKCFALALLDQQLKELFAAPLFLSGELPRTGRHAVAFLWFFGSTLTLVQLDHQGLEGRVGLCEPRGDLEPPVFPRSWIARVGLQLLESLGLSDILVPPIVGGAVPPRSRRPNLGSHVRQLIFEMLGVPGCLGCDAGDGALEVVHPFHELVELLAV